MQKIDTLMLASITDEQAAVHCSDRSSPKTVAHAPCTFTWVPSEIFIFRKVSQSVQLKQSWERVAWSHPPSILHMPPSLTTAWLILDEIFFNEMSCPAHFTWYLKDSTLWHRHWRTLERMSDLSVPSLSTLPIEIIYRILDHLRPRDILISAYSICARWQLTIDTYQPHQVKLTQSLPTVKILAKYLFIDPVWSEEFSLCIIISNFFRIDRYFALALLLCFSHHHFHWSVSSGHLKPFSSVNSFDDVPSASSFSSLS